MTYRYVIFDEEYRFTVPSAAEPTYGAQIGPATLVNVHPASACQGRPCVIHAPSEHHMRAWTLNWRGDRGFMERLCPAHGVGHPDPDDLAWQESQGRDWMAVHGCCGCCVTKPLLGGLDTGDTSADA